MRFRLQQALFRDHQVIREGVIQAGKQNFLDKVFVEPEISTSGCGGIYPTHDLRPPASPVPVPSPDTFVGLNNLIRLKKDDGTPVRTLVTTGLPGVGMSVCVGKFCLDWAEQRANKVRCLQITASVKPQQGVFWAGPEWGGLSSLSLYALHSAYPDPMSASGQSWQEKAFGLDPAVDKHVVIPSLQQELTVWTIFQSRALDTWRALAVTLKEHRNPSSFTRSVSLW